MPNFTLMPSARSRAHPPLRLERVWQRRLGEDCVPGQATDTACSATERSELHRRYAAPVAPDAASVTTCLCILELLRGRKVQVGECRRFAE